jgi:GntR family transcriptional regulator
MTNMNHLDPQSPVPLYIQLKNVLLKLIHSENLKPHERLPSERELSQEYGISRMTIRQALQSLIRDGLLYTRIGKGTFVSEIRLEQGRTLTGFSQEMIRRGLKPSSILLEASIVPASAEIATALDIDENSGVVRISRLRMANNQVIAIEIAYLPHALCPGLLDDDFSKSSLYDVLQNKYGIRLVSAEQTMEAALANNHELKMLQLKSPAAVLRMKRATSSEQGTIVEYTESVYRGDRYKLTASLQIPSR